MQNKASEYLDPYSLAESAIYARDCGGKASFYYRPTTALEQDAFEEGLDHWLREHGIWGISGADISQPDALKGFVLSLLASGREVSAGPYAGESAKDQLGRMLVQCAALYEQNPDNSHYSAKRSNLMKGVELAGQLLDEENFQQFDRKHALVYYGLNLDDVEDAGRFYDAHRSLMPQLRATQSEHIDEYVAAASDLYHEGTELIEVYLRRGMHDSALSLCDRLELILLHMGKIKAELMQDGCDYLRRDTYQMSEEDLIDEIPQLSGIELELDFIKGVRSEIALRADDQQYDLRQRMIAYAALEDYETAAALRDDLNLVLLVRETILLN
ncbi:MAG: hypothetical protein ABH879_08550 [archaeon]